MRVGLLFFVGSFSCSIFSGISHAGPKILLKTDSHGVVAVAAADPDGQEMVNTAPNCRAVVRLLATGMWRHDPLVPWHDDRGAASEIHGTPKFRSLPTGALVISSDLRTGRAVNPRTQYVVEPRQTAYILMNDNVESYFDNEGALQVAWQATLDCK